MSGRSTIAIIGGTGAEGGGIALRLAKAGHRVLIGSRDAAKAKAAAAELTVQAGAEITRRWQSRCRRGGRDRHPDRALRGAAADGR